MDWVGAQIIKLVRDMAFRRIMELIVTVYLNDSVAMKTYAYDFALECGSISNKRLLIDRRDTFGEPDGMVVE